MTITIESGHAMPKGRQILTSQLGALRAAIKQMRSGQSFVWHDNRHPYKAAQQVNATIKTVKLNGQGYRIWRVK